MAMPTPCRDARVLIFKPGSRLFNAAGLFSVAVTKCSRLHEKVGLFAFRVLESQEHGTSPGECPLTVIAC